MSRFKKEDRENYKNLILQVGEEQFSQKGLINVTVDEIAKEVGIGKGTFYHYYLNKEHLFMEIVNRRQVQIYEVLEQYFDLEMSSEEKVYFLLKKYMEEVFKYPMLASMDEEVYIRIDKKVPKEARSDNNEVDEQMIAKLIEGGVKFNVSIDEVRKILQLVFVNAILLQKNKEDKTLEILLRAICQYIVVK